MKSGVYKITNIIDDRVYIGSSFDYKGRWNDHKRDLLNNLHHNIHLQNFVNKYGIDTINFELIELVNDKTELLIQEQYYIDNTKNLFNIAKYTSAPMLGRNHSIEECKNISNRTKGENNPMYGKKRPQWLIDKLKAHNIGRKLEKQQKVKRMINMANRKEILLVNEITNEKIYCISVSQAVSILNIGHHRIVRKLDKDKTINGYFIRLSTDNFFKKDILLLNMDKFDDNLFPNSDLIEILKKEVN